MKLQGWWVHSSGNSALAALTRLLPTIVCWELWKARNKVCFEDVVTTRTGLLHQITLQLHAVGHAFPFRCTNTGDATLRGQGLVPFLVYPRHRTIALSWSCPTRPYVKLNVDGSSLGNPGDSGGGGLVRDNSGCFLYGFSSYYGWQTNMHAEASARLEGIQLCLSQGYGHVLVELDSLTLLNVVQGRSKCPWRIFPIVSAI
nr:uncharacterized protein LOC113724357 [Coffea arabica]